MKCQSCHARSKLFLCASCTEELRAALLSLAEGPWITTVGGKTKSGGNWHIERRTPGLLADLADVVNRKTRVGRGSGPRKRGDERPALYEPDGEKGRTRQGRGADLMDAARNTLTTLVRDLCESRGVLVPATDLEGCAAYLARHVHALACGSGAGHAKSEVDSLVLRITHVIDRPTPPRFCGQCDTATERTICGAWLYAPHDATEVCCAACETEHDIVKLRERWLSSIDYQIMPRDQIIGNQRTVNPELYDTGIMGALDEFVSWRQFNRWCQTGELLPVRYVRSTGARVFARHSKDDVPEYRIGDVRAVRLDMIQRRVC